jgi:small-conductance mechanosensitive channel
MGIFRCFGVHDWLRDWNDLFFQEKEMVLTSSKKILVAFTVTLACLSCVCFASQVNAETTEPVPQKQITYPDLSEVVPKASALAARIAETETLVQKAESRQNVYAKLDVINDSLETLESQYNDWETVDTWQINRLLRAQSIYTDLALQQEKPMDNINTQLKTLEDLRGYWHEEKAYWQNWQEHLKKSGVRVPIDVFLKTVQSIDALLKRISRISSELVKSQETYAPGREVISSRLNTISKTLEMRRRDTFERNTFAMFEVDYYRQFERDLFSGFANALITALSFPANFFQRYGGVVFLHLLVGAIIALSLIYRRKQSKPLTEEWLFLFKRPFAAAAFICIFASGMFTDLLRNLPLVWGWLVKLTVIIAAMRLVNAFYERPLAKITVRVVAGLYLFNESIRFFGLPTPLMQLYIVLLSSVAIPGCWYVIRRQHELLFGHKLLIKVTLGAAIISLITATFGFENLATNLVDGVLSSFVLYILLKMALKLSDSGIEALIMMDWVKTRNFIEVLGPETGIRKLQTLLRALFIFNAGIYFLVIWLVFDNYNDATEAIFGYTVTIGEFSISVKMVILVVVVLYLTTLASWVIQAFVDSQIMTPRKMDLGVKESLKRLTHYGLITLGFLIAVSMAGLDLQKFTILAGALGVGIGFGLQNIVNNFVSGLILLFERPVKIGDVINIDQDWGTITKIGLRSTIFETFDRSEIIVPNADLISNKVTNWTYSSKIVRVILPVGVAYGSPLEKVLDILKRSGTEHPDVLSYPPVSPIFVGFGNSSIDFELRVWIHTIDDRLKIRSELGVIVDRLFREEGIEIPFPQRDLHLRSVDSKLQPLFSGNLSQTETENEGHSE